MKHGSGKGHGKCYLYQFGGILLIDDWFVDGWARKGKGAKVDLWFPMLSNK